MARNKHLDSPHLKSYVRELISEDPESYKLRASLRGSIRIEDATGIEWAYKGWTVHFDEQSTYSRYRVGGYHNGFSFETLTAALDYIEACITKTLPEPG